MTNKTELELFEHLSKFIEFKQGKPYWNKDVGYKIKKGSLAGSADSKDCWQVGITYNSKERLVLANRLNYYMHYKKAPEIVRHIDGDVQNNDISNLEAVSHSVHQRSKKKARGKSSKYKGVSYIKRDNVFRAYIYLNGKNKCLGSFRNEIDAALVYDHAIIINGMAEYAKMNFKKNLN
jgi:hypothetical protein